MSKSSISLDVRRFDGILRKFGTFQINLSVNFVKIPSNMRGINFPQKYRYKAGKLVL